MRRISTPLMLPFLQKKNWPQKAKISGEARYGFSEDDDLLEDAVTELLAAFDAKDPHSLITALTALVDVLRAKETHAELHEEA